MWKRPSSNFWPTANPGSALFWQLCSCFLQSLVPSRRIEFQLLHQLHIPCPSYPRTTFQVGKKSWTKINAAQKTRFAIARAYLLRRFSYIYNFGEILLVKSSSFFEFSRLVSCLEQKLCEYGSTPLKYVTISCFTINGLFQWKQQSQRTIIEMLCNRHDERRKTRIGGRDSRFS